jgi:quercetin dioxygenase-like cupin family protein
MTTVDLNTIELNEFFGVVDKSQHCRATFPLLGAHGTKKLATVYFELEPGDQLGRHTDSAEELLLILDGDVQVEVGGESARASARSAALVPEMVPHNIVNTGKSTARVLGVFGGDNNIVATFEQAMEPTNTNIVDTAQMG